MACVVNVQEGSIQSQRKAIALARASEITAFQKRRKVAQIVGGLNAFSLNMEARLNLIRSTPSKHIRGDARRDIGVHNRMGVLGRHGSRRNNGNHLGGHCSLFRQETGHGIGVKIMGLSRSRPRQRIFAALFGELLLISRNLGGNGLGSGRIIGISRQSAGIKHREGQQN